MSGTEDVELMEWSLASDTCSKHRHTSQILRFSVSDLSRISGIFEYPGSQPLLVCDMILKHLYQDLPDLLDEDLRALSDLGISAATETTEELLSKLPSEQREKIDQILKSVDSAQNTSTQAMSAAQQLSSLLAPEPAVSVAAVPVAAVQVAVPLVQEPILIAVSEPVPAPAAVPEPTPVPVQVPVSVSPPGLTPAQRAQLLSDLKHGVYCSFGKRGESPAARAYELHRAQPLVERNSRNLVWAVRSLAELSILAEEAGRETETEIETRPGTGTGMRIGLGAEPKIVKCHARFTWELPYADIETPVLPNVQLEVAKVLGHLMDVIETNDKIAANPGARRLGPSLESFHILRLAERARTKEQSLTQAQQTQTQTKAPLSPPLFYLIGRPDGLCFLPCETSGITTEQRVRIEQSRQIALERKAQRARAEQNRLLDDFEGKSPVGGQNQPQAMSSGGAFEVLGGANKEEKCRVLPPSMIRPPLATEDSPDLRGRPQQPPSSAPVPPIAPVLAPAPTPALAPVLVPNLSPELGLVLARAGPALFPIPKVDKVVVEIKCRVSSQLSSKKAAPPIQDLVQLAAYTVMTKSQYGDLVDSVSVVNQDGGGTVSFDAELSEPVVSISTFRIKRYGKAQDNQSHCQMLLGVVLPRVAQVAAIIRLLREKSSLRVAFVGMYSEVERVKLLQDHLDWVEDLPGSNDNFAFRDAEPGELLIGQQWPKRAQPHECQGQRTSKRERRNPAEEIVDLT